jgi:integrase
MGYTTSIRIVLKNIGKDNIGTVNLEVVFIEDDTKKKLRRYVSTNQRIQKDDYSQGRIKQVERTKLARQIVEKEKVNLSDFLRNLLLEHDEVTPQVYDIAKMKNPHAKRTVSELFDEFIEFKEYDCEPLTIKKHKTTKALLEEYVKSTGNSTLVLPELNLKFYNNFTKFLVTEKNHAPSTVHKYQTSLKAFLAYLTEELGLNRGEVHKKFKKSSKVQDGGSKVVLLKEQVKRLIDWKPTNSRYELVRDLFLFQIFTGIRYSDLVNLNRSFVMNNSLSFDMWKVNKRVTIPLHPDAQRILEKYDYNLGEKCKALQNYNTDLKTMCELAGLKDEFHSLKIKLNRKVTDNTPLYKLISTHVGRTTFITNCLIAGISPFIVMEYTGHNDIDTLKGYMRMAGKMSEEAFKKFEDYFKF